MILGGDLLGKEPAGREHVCVCVVGVRGEVGHRGTNQGKEGQGLVTQGGRCGCSDRAQ